MEVIRGGIFFCIVLTFAFGTEIQRRGCSDLHDWCDTVSSFCNTTASMRTMCPKTCDACLPPECDECQQACTMEGTSVKCTCYKGYRLASNGKQCEDIDECVENKTACRNTTACTNYAGGFDCDKCHQYSDKHFTSFYSHPTECCKMKFGTCGKNVQNTQGRVVGGQDARFQMWPWQAFILLKSQLCGGSLINDRWIVTAAHCFASIKNLEDDRVDVRLGVYNTSDLQASFIQVRRVVKLIKHEKYKFPNYDIALVKLNESVVFSDDVSPICLPNGELPTTGTLCQATGFGVTVPGGSASEILQQVTVNIVDRQTCKKAYEGEQNIDTKTMICAGGEKGKDACQGDSGGPLVCQRCNSCEWYLAGVTSFGKGCGEESYFGVYTDVENTEKWIEKNIEEIEVTKETCEPIAWSEWREWRQCSCRVGRQTRRRTCLGGEPGLPGCLGEHVETRKCKCTDPVKDSWTQWTSCPVTCGGGQQKRERICVTKNCIEVEENRQCNTSPCPVWEEWGRWSECDTTCGEGERTRTRECENGRRGQKGCEGINNQVEICNLGSCPAWDEWSPWSDCSVSCGGGFETAQRECQNGISGTDCPGMDSKKRRCNTHTCKVVFEPWSRWSRCSDRCGSGTQTRTRECPKSECISDQFGQKTTQERSCNTHECTGEWTMWSAWDECSATCGPGTRRRVRKCQGGTKCLGSRVETTECSAQDCVGQWSKWSRWGECSATCGDASRTRTRTCESGINCPGSDAQNQYCSLADCVLWSDWGSWSACTATCGGGSRSKTRHCLQGRCTGSNLESENCATENCGASCEGRCGRGVMSGHCRTAKGWMNSFCPSACCGTFCQNTWDRCEEYGTSYCGDSNFAVACLRMCGYCS